MLDYRYRFSTAARIQRVRRRLALFAGHACVRVYLGAGLQWRNVLPGWDIGLDYRSVLYAQRERDLPTDPEPLATAKTGLPHQHLQLDTVYLAKF